jgi:hypothetical protein
MWFYGAGVLTAVWPAEQIFQYLVEVVSTISVVDDVRRRREESTMKMQEPFFKHAQWLT